MAVVEVDCESTKTLYLKKPFIERPDFASTAVIYDVGRLVWESEIVHQKGDSYV